MATVRRWREWRDVDGSHTAHVENCDISSDEVNDRERAKGHALVLNLDFATPWFKRVNRLLYDNLLSCRSPLHDPVDLICGSQCPRDCYCVCVPPRVPSNSCHSCACHHQGLFRPCAIEVEHLNSDRSGNQRVTVTVYKKSGKGKRLADYSFSHCFLLFFLLDRDVTAIHSIEPS